MILALSGDGSADWIRVGSDSLLWAAADFRGLVMHKIAAEFAAAIAMRERERERWWGGGDGEDLNQSNSNLPGVSEKLLLFLLNPVTRG